MSSETIVSTSRPVCLVGGASATNADISNVLQLVAGFVAVDSGADTLLRAGITPIAVVGDLDSLSQTARDTFANLLCQIDEQSTTDFEKALTRVAAPAIIALGFTGGRMDHILSVLNVMSRFPDKPVLLTDRDDVSFLRATTGPR